MNKQETIDTALSFKYGGMSRDELGLLYDMCQDARVVEVGSMVGMSSFVIAEVCRHLYCVDLWPDTHEHIEPRQRAIYEAFSSECPDMWAAFNANMKPMLGSSVTTLRSLSWEAAPLIPDHWANIILIDADHSYEGVERDYNAYLPKLASGGYIAFHDYGSAMWPGVKEFVDKQAVLELVGRVGYLAVFKKKAE